LTWSHKTAAKFLAMDSQTTMGSIPPDIPSLPEETQVIASILLKYVEGCILDANCSKDYELDDDYGEHILIEHEESRQFKKSLTNFLTSYVNDSSTRLHERMSNSVDGDSALDTTLSSSDLSNSEYEQGNDDSFLESNGVVPTVTTDSGPANGSSAPFVVKLKQQSDAILSKNPGNDRPEDLSSEPPTKRLRMGSEVKNEGDVKNETGDFADLLRQANCTPTAQKTMDTIEAFSVRISDIRRACETFKRQESSDAKIETLFMGIWNNRGVEGVNPFHGGVRQLTRHIIWSLNMVVFAKAIGQRCRYIFTPFPTSFY
jgi:hypothetical protein